MRKTNMPQAFEPRLSPTEYSAILGALDLRGVFLDDLKATVDRKAFRNADALPVTITEDSEYEIDNGFIVHTTLKVSCSVDRRKCFTVTAGYTLAYDAEEDVGQEFFEIFRVLNLPLTIWPFFRELVNSVTCRMGIPPLTLPLQRVNVGADSNIE